MTRGVPDDSDIVTERWAPEIDPYAELVGRLGGIISTRPGGRIVFADDFSEGLAKWVLLSGGTNRATTLTNLVGRTSGLAVRFDSGTGLSPVCMLRRGQATLAVSMLALELSFCYAEARVKIGLFFQHYVSDRAYLYAVVYNCDLGTLSYENSAAGWTVLASGLFFETEYDIWEALKVYIDIVNEKYKGVCINGVLYDMTGVAPYVLVAGYTPRCEYGIYVEGDVATSRRVLVTDFILTDTDIAV